MLRLAKVVWFSAVFKLARAQLGRPVPAHALYALSNVDLGSQLHVVENYRRAAGIIAALRAGISSESVRRPLPPTVAVKKTLRAGTTTQATPAVS